MAIRDSRFQPPQDRYGVTGRQYPTPNIFDAVVVEDVTRNKERYQSLMPGTPHPDDATRLLVWKGSVKGNNNEMALHLVYCSKRGAQDAYNAVTTYSGEQSQYPIWNRTYFLPRSGFAPLAERTELDSVIGLTLTAGGTGYVGDDNGRVALVFSGGGGTGAAGYAQVVKGVLVALLLTNGGSGYTSAPTVSITANATATITASIQFSSSYKVITGVTVNSGGTNYLSGASGTLPVAISGDGTKADATAIVVLGVVTSVELIYAGEQYTAIPTASVTGLHTIAASLTVTTSRQRAYLTKQHQEPQQGEFESIFLKADRTWETLPGPLMVVDFGFEKETGALHRRYEQRVLQGSTTIEQKHEFPIGSGFFVTDCGVRKDITNKNAGTLYIETMELPDGRTEWSDENFPIPDVFVPISGYAAWPIPASFPGCPGGPYQNRSDGVDYLGASLSTYTGPNLDHYGTYDLQVHSPASPLRRVITYALAFSAPTPGYAVTSQPSRIGLPIGRNTIHKALTAVYNDSGGGQVIIENIRDSDPASYVSGWQPVSTVQQQWGDIWIKQIITSAYFPAPL